MAKACFCPAFNLQGKAKLSKASLLTSPMIAESTKTRQDKVPKTILLSSEKPATLGTRPASNSCVSRPCWKVKTTTAHCSGQPLSSLKLKCESGWSQVPGHNPELQVKSLRVVSSALLQLCVDFVHDHGLGVPPEHVLDGALLDAVLDVGVVEPLNGRQALLDQGGEALGVSPRDRRDGGPGACVLEAELVAVVGPLVFEGLGEERLLGQLEVLVHSPELLEQHVPGELPLHDVGPVEAVKAVGPHDPALAFPAGAVVAVVLAEQTQLLHQQVDLVELLAFAVGVEVEVNVGQPVLVGRVEAVEGLFPLAGQGLLAGLRVGQQVDHGQVAVPAQQVVHVLLKGLRAQLVRLGQAQVGSDPGLLPVHRHRASDLQVGENLVLDDHDLLSLHEIGHLAEPVDPAAVVPGAGPFAASPRDQRQAHVAGIEDCEEALD